jgi:hypothetical protein
MNFVMNVSKVVNVKCIHNNNNNNNKQELQKQRLQHYKYQLTQNRLQMKQLSKLAKFHCDANTPLNQQPQCRFIIDEMMKTASRGRELDIEYLLYDITYNQDDNNE